MDAPDNHYRFLGLENGAPRWEVEAAVERLSEQAATLVYTSPQRSHELWERIRRIKDDLLKDDARREAYNRALLEDSTAHPDDEVDHVAALKTAFKEAQRARRISGASRFSWSSLAAPLAIVVVSVTLAVLARGPVGSPTNPTPATQALALSTNGARLGNAYRSGQPVVLSWSRVLRAILYRVQVATRDGDPSDAAIFRHPLITSTTTKTTYPLRVVGAQTYYWRVQAKVSGKWQLYTHSQHFLVARPAISTPNPMLPRSGTTVFTNRVTFCWSSVTHAAGYDLRIQRTGTRSASGSCSRVTLPAGTYHWAVAALVRGVHLYSGSYSAAAILIVQAKPGKQTKHQALLAARRSSRLGARPIALRAVLRTQGIPTSTTPSIPRSVAQLLPARTKQASSGSRSPLRPTTEGGVSRTPPHPRTGPHPVRSGNRPKPSRRTPPAPPPPPASLPPPQQPPVAAAPAAPSQPPVVYVNGGSWAQSPGRVRRPPAAGSRASPPVSAAPVAPGPQPPVSSARAPSVTPAVPRSAPRSSAPVPRSNHKKG